MLLSRSDAPSASHLRGLNATRPSSVTGCEAGCAAAGPLLRAGAAGLRGDAAEPAACAERHWPGDSQPAAARTAALAARCASGESGAPVGAAAAVDVAQLGGQLTL